MTSHSFQKFDSSCLFHILVGITDESPLNAAGRVGKDVQKNYGEKRKRDTVLNGLVYFTKGEQ